MKLIKLKEKRTNVEWVINPDDISRFYAHSVSIDDIATRIAFRSDGTFIDFKISVYDLERLLSDKKIEKEFDAKEFASLKHG